MKNRDIKISKWYKSLCARNPNKKKRKNKIVPRTHKLEEGEGRNKDFIFQKKRYKKKKLGKVESGTACSTSS